MRVLPAVTNTSTHASPELPTVSVATALTVCVPGVEVVVSHATVPPGAMLPMG